MSIEQFVRNHIMTADTIAFADVYINGDGNPTVDVSYSGYQRMLLNKSDVLSISGFTEYEKYYTRLDQNIDRRHIMTGESHATFVLTGRLAEKAKKLLEELE